jgi:type IX secretion system PorP/SprF family membrane protein
MSSKNISMFFLLFSLSCAAQHNAVYTQYMFNGLLINPAYAGSSGALNFTAIYRNQWAGLDGAPVNLNISLHSPMKNDHHGIGFAFTNDKFGIVSSNKLSLIYAYRIKIKKSSLSLGLQAGVNSYQSDWTKIRSSESTDPSFTGNVQRSVAPQAGAGIYFQSPKFFLGISVPEFLQSNYNYMPYILFSGLLIKISDNFRVKPAFMFKYIENSPAEIDLSATVYWKDIIGIGVGYRPKHSLITFLDLRIREQFHIGYAYDHNLNKLRNYAGGSHEVMLRYLFLYKVSAQSSRYF